MRNLRLTGSLLALSFLLASGSEADTIINMGTFQLGPSGVSAPAAGTALGSLTGIRVDFGWSFNGGNHTDFSWSADTLFNIIDPSADLIVLGDGIDTTGDIGWSGNPGSPMGNSDAGIFFDIFDIANIQASVPTFGEAGQYIVLVQDGWNDGSEITTYANVTVTLFFTAVPEPGTLLCSLLLAPCLVLVRRRR